MNGSSRRYTVRRKFDVTEFFVPVFFVFAGLLTILSVYINVQIGRTERTCVTMGYDKSFYGLRSGPYCMKMENGNTVVHKLK
jgi:hypothetical protein